jgi:hypothetical protein
MLVLIIKVGVDGPERRSQVPILSAASHRITWIVLDLRVACYFICCSAAVGVSRQA